MTVELYKKISKSLCVIIVSSLFSLENIEDRIHKFSLIDFSSVGGNEFYFNVGYQSNIDSYFFSLDKLMGDNLILSTKISKVNIEKFGILNQNTLSLKINKIPINFVLSTNYFLENSNLEKWTSIGLIINSPLRGKYKFLIGSYTDLSSSNSQLINNINLFLGSKIRLSNRISAQISSSYNTKISNFNNLVEFRIQI